MEFNNIKTYLAIAIIGVMVGVLYLVIQDDLPKTLTIFFITLYVIVVLRFILERKHYKKHKSILASTQFLLLPYSIMLIGNYISPIAFTWEIFKINIDLSGGDSIQSLFNLISISLLFPLIALSMYFGNYYSGKWPAIAVNRKVKRGRKIPFLIHSLFVTLLLIGFFINWEIDLVGFIFVVFYIIYVFRYFIIVALVKERRQVTTTPSRSSSSSSRTSPQRSSRASRGGSVPTTSRSGTTAVPTRSRSTRTPTASARVAPGIEVRTGRVAKTKSKPAIKNLFPIGTPKKEEMQCIICYMDFDKKDTRRIILCPNCKYPAHENEFLNWFKKSKLCARCNQAISTSYVRNPKYRITIKIYIEKVIERL